MIEKDYNNEKISKKCKKMKISPKMKNEKLKHKKKQKNTWKKRRLDSLQNPKSHVYGSFSSFLDFINLCFLFVSTFCIILLKTWNNLCNIFLYYFIFVLVSSA